MADATQLVNCSTATGQQLRNSRRQGVFLLAEHPLIAVSIDHTYIHTYILNLSAEDRVASRAITSQPST